MVLNNNNKVKSVDDLVLENVLSVMDFNNSWTGTMTELREQFIRLQTKRDVKKLVKVLPKSPNSLRVVLNRITNRLRTRGLSVKFGRTPDHARNRFIKLVNNA